MPSLISTVSGVSQRVNHRALLSTEVEAGAKCVAFRMAFVFGAGCLGMRPFGLDHTRSDPGAYAVNDGLNVTTAYRLCIEFGVRVSDWWIDKLPREEDQAMAALDVVFFSRGVFRNRPQQVFFR